MSNSCGLERARACSLENCGRGEGLGSPYIIAVVRCEQGLAPLRIMVEVKVLVRHIL